MKGSTILVGAGLALAALVALTKIAGAAAPAPPPAGETTTPAYVPPATPANITAIGTPAPNVTSPVAGEIDINSLTWQNTGGQSDSFIPKVSIDGGTPIALTTTTITLAPGATHTVTNKALTGLSITTAAHTVCPVPN